MIRLAFRFGTVNIVLRGRPSNRSAQIQAPVGLSNIESECCYQMRHQLMLKGWF
jgi:hypothetical protein